MLFGFGKRFGLGGIEGPAPSPPDQALDPNIEDEEEELRAVIAVASRGSEREHLVIKGTLKIQGSHYPLRLMIDSGSAVDLLSD